MSNNKILNINPITRVIFNAKDDIITKTFIMDSETRVSLIFDIFFEIIAFGIRNNIDVAIETAFTILSNFIILNNIVSNVDVDLSQDKKMGFENDVSFEFDLDLKKEMNFSVINEINISFNKEVLLSQLDELTLGELDQYTIGFNATVDGLDDYDGLTLGEIDSLILGNLDNSPASISGVVTSLELISEKIIDGIDLTTEIVATNNLILVRLGKLSDYDSETLGDLDSLTLAEMDETII